MKTNKIISRIDLSKILYQIKEEIELKQLLKKAVKEKADLSGAYLSGARIQLGNRIITIK